MMTDSTPTNSFDSQFKDSNLIAFFLGKPDPYFSDTGIRNASRRFNLDGTDLQKVTAELIMKQINERC
jgi:hypothetical protein